MHAPHSLPHGCIRRQMAEPQADNHCERASASSLSACERNFVEQLAFQRPALSSGDGMLETAASMTDPNALASAGTEESGDRPSVAVDCGDGDFMDTTQPSGLPEAPDTARAPGRSSQPRLLSLSSVQMLHKHARARQEQTHVQRLPAAATMPRRSTMASSPRVSQLPMLQRQRQGDDPLSCCQGSPRSWSTSRRA